MFDVGFWEIILIFGLGLMVLGPEKLPRIAAQLGRWVGRARRTASQLRWQLEREIDMDDQKRRYTPPPKSSQIIPPPGKQPSKQTEAGEAEADTPPAPADEASAGPAAEAKREPGDAA
jgi:Tat protein translocase TatB subunit